MSEKITRERNRHTPTEIAAGALAAEAATEETAADATGDEETEAVAMAEAGTVAKP